MILKVTFHLYLVAGGCNGSSHTSQAAGTANQRLALFAKLQQQIPGFENIPSPRVLSEQIGSDRRMKEPLKNVSRSNLFVQCIARDGVEKGLQTDHQATHSVWSALDNQEIQSTSRNYGPEVKMDANDASSGRPGDSGATPMQYGSYDYPYMQPQQEQQIYGHPQYHPYYYSHQHQYNYMPPEYGTPGVTQDAYAQDMNRQPERNWQGVDRAWGEDLDRSDRSERSRRREHSPDGERRSPVRQRRSPDRQRRSPVRHRRSPVRQRRSHDRNRSSPDRQRNSPNRHRLSSDRYTVERRKSPQGREKNSTSSGEENSSKTSYRRYRKYLSSVGQNKYIETTGKTSEEERILTRASNPPSIKELKEKYELFLKNRDGIASPSDQMSEKQDSNSESSVFKRPLPPPSTKSKSRHSETSGPPREKQSRFSNDYSSVPPPVFKDVKPSTKSNSRHSETSGPPRPKQRFSKDFCPVPPSEFNVKPYEKTRREREKDPGILGTAHIASKYVNKDSSGCHAFPSEATSTYDAEKAKLAMALASTKPNRNSVECIKDPRQPNQGGTVSDFIANFISTVCKSKGGLQIVANKYKLPGNCIGLLPPKMTQDVWSILAKPTQVKDEMLQDVERWLALGLIPIIRLICIFGTCAQSAKEVRCMTSDALTVLGYVCRNMSIKRRLLMRNALNKKYAVLCRTSNCVSDYIFGGNLAKDLMEIKLGNYHIRNSNEEDNDDIFAPNYKLKFCAGLALVGPDADVNVAGMINMACANDGDVEDLREKYMMPLNCDCLLPSRINPEIWSLLSRSGLEIDYRLQDVQLCISEGMIPLMKLLQSIHEKKYDPDVTLGRLTDALALLGNSIYQMNKVRMELMMKTLPIEAHGFCRWYWSGAEQVSGDHLEVELQAREESDTSKMADVILGVVKAQKNQHS
ncbi:uncharacterized protein LOC124118745 isoform X1 [Haliotis rufescens]|uniref:uncharacterized protein LOC124118745 isoform X1 n=1 Tax=Haliotis rufescens TaxID=6454 RepID=UPI00201F402C|nr:uncharacterized protein LOC124118745 isoform X1 [Haliotis rufescens]